MIGRITERFAQAPNRVIQTMVEIDECMGTPEAHMKGLARDQFAWMLKQQGQNREGLLLKPNPMAILPQLATVKIQLERTKTYQLSGGTGRQRHATPRAPVYHDATNTGSQSREPHRGWSEVET